MAAAGAYRPSIGQLLGNEPAKGVAYDRGFHLQLTDGVGIVVGDLLNALVGERLRILIGRLYAFGMHLGEGAGDPGGVAVLL